MCLQGCCAGTPALPCPALLCLTHAAHPAGVAIGCAAALSGLALGTLLVRRRRGRHRRGGVAAGPMDPKLSGASGSVYSAATSDDVAALWARGGGSAGNASSMQKLVAQLLSEAPSPQVSWLAG